VADVEVAGHHDVVALASQTGHPIGDSGEEAELLIHLLVAVGIAGVDVGRHDRERSVDTLEVERGLHPTTRTVIAGVLAADVDSLGADREMRHHRDAGAALGFAFRVDPMPIGPEHRVDMLDEDVVGGPNLLHGHDVGGAFRDPRLHAVAFRGANAVDVDRSDRKCRR
jgi:hypothetical protein